MINATDILADFSRELASRCATEPGHPFQPLQTSPWIAMSLTQKALRRGLPDIAKRAAATLLLAAPERLWRRLGIVAVEDVGLAGIEAVGLCAAALQSKHLRSRLGGEWVVACTLIDVLAGAAKCRAADDLFMAAPRHPDLAEARLDFASYSRHQLRAVILGTASLRIKSVALLYLLGTDGYGVDGFAPRRGEPAIAFDVLDELGVPLTVLELSRTLYRKTRVYLCGLLPLLSMEEGWRYDAETVDFMPPDRVFDGVPGWSLDMFTREGGEALRRLAAMKGTSPAGQYAAWLSSTLAGQARRRFHHEALFHTEGGLLGRRALSPLNRELRHAAELECFGVPPDVASEGLSLLRAAIPELNDIRARVMEAQDHAR